jgi:hypothetical protein
MSNISFTPVEYMYITGLVNTCDALKPITLEYLDLASDTSTEDILKCVTELNTTDKKTPDTEVLQNVLQIFMKTKISCDGMGQDDLALVKTIKMSSYKILGILLPERFE